MEKYQQVTEKLNKGDVTQAKSLQDYTKSKQQLSALEELKSCFDETLSAFYKANENVIDFAYTQDEYFSIYFAKKDEFLIDANACTRFNTLLEEYKKNYDSSIGQNTWKNLKSDKVITGNKALTDANILITGENGTGKEMLAREIHLLSRRKEGPMIPVDMGAITETLFESELFGYVKGAFTDARADHAGKFEAANNGTLFLDEIGNLSYHLQAKLLTALQRRSIVRVGSNIPIPVNIRLISATNRNLESMVNKDEFREDLLYRINTIHVEIPSLRERKEDIVPLAEIFIEKYCTIYNKKILALDDQVKEKLQEQTWTGNIRELEHTIEKAVIICDEPVLNSFCFDFSKTQVKEEENIHNEEVRTLEEMECQMIKSAMEKNEGNLCFK